MSSALLEGVLNLSHIGKVEGFSVLEELQVLDLALSFIVSCIEFADRPVLLLRQVEPHSRQNLSELFRGNLEPAEFVPVLEHLLDVESVGKLEFPERFFDSIGSLELIL